MQETFNVTADGSAMSPEAAHRNIERAALRDLVLLSTQCADDETQIEDRRESGRKAQQEAHKQAALDAQKRRSDEEADVRRQYDEQIALVEGKFTSETASLDQSTQAARRRIAHEKHAVEHNVKEQVGQAIWLADSLLEGPGKAPRRDQEGPKGPRRAHQGPRRT